MQKCELKPLTQLLPCRGNRFSDFDPDTYEQWRVDAYNAEIGSLSDFNCKECNNKGFVAKLDRGGKFCLTRCVCNETRRSIRILEKSGLRDLVGSCKFSTYETNHEWQEKVKLAAMEYVRAADGSWWFLSGRPGTGKTHLCVAICRELMLRGVPTKYCLWREEIAVLKDYGVNSDERLAMMDELKNVPLLYIDDFLKVGKREQPTTADINIAFEIINSRYVKGLRTVISTELTMGEILSLDEALGSRIYEKTGGRIIRLSDAAKNHRMEV